MAKKAMAEDYKTHFRNNYETSLNRYIKVKKFSSIISIFFVISLYTFLLIAVSGIFIYLLLPLLIISSVSGLFAFLGFFYRIVRPQKKKDILAVHLFEASKYFQAFKLERSHDNETKAEEFLKKSLKELKAFSNQLEDYLESSNISLNLPDLAQLKKLQKNSLERVYPLIENGKNTNEDILLSLSKLFFYDNEYEGLKELNLTIEQTLQPKIEIDQKNFTFTRLKENSLFVGITSSISIVFIVLIGIYILKYPISFDDYRNYIGINAATIIASIVASTVALNTFLVKRKPKSD